MGIELRLLIALPGGENDLPMSLPMSLWRLGMPRKRGGDDA
jgi:hypothetical protein